jgi:hypothetical protein
LRVAQNPQRSSVGCMTTQRHPIAILAALVCSACAGNGDGLDQNGRPIAPGGGNGVLTADVQSIQDNVFTPVCTACHVGAGAPMGLSLDAANSFNMDVGGRLWRGFWCG